MCVWLPLCLSEGGILSLYNIYKDTSGFFICTSTNKMGSASYNFTLAVMPRERNLLLAAFPLTVWELGIPTKHIFTTLHYNMHPFLLPLLPTRLPCSFHERCLHCRNHWWSNRCVDRAHHRHLLLLLSEEEKGRGIRHGVKFFSLKDTLTLTDKQDAVMWTGWTSDMAHSQCLKE